MAQGNEEQKETNKQADTKVAPKTDDAPTISNQTATATAKKYDDQPSVNTGDKAGVKSTGAVTTGAIKEFYDKAKDTAGQVTEKATDKLDEKKAVVTQGLSGVADSLRQVGENLRGANGEENPIGQFAAKYGDAFAGQVEQISTYFERKDVREIVRDVESFAKRNPAVFIGSAFALGILAARFLKSSSPTNRSVGKGRALKSAGQKDDSIFAGDGVSVAAEPSSANRS